MNLPNLSTRSRATLLALLVAVGAFATGCTFSTTPNISVAAEPVYVQPAHVVVASPPPRVYYSGQWLYYRNDGYYYSSGPSWVRASAVPPHVVHYHSRPAHVVHGRPAHVVTSRPAPPPVHVRRTVGPTRTYYRR